STVRVEGRLAAFDLGLVHGNRLWTLKGAYDESLRSFGLGVMLKALLDLGQLEHHAEPESLRSFGLGVMLKLAEIEECFARGLEACEILGEREDWKTRLATGERPHVVLRAYRRRLAGRYLYRRYVRPALKRARVA